MNMHTLFQDKVSLAGNFLDDGAPISAARVLRQLADELEAHGNVVAAELRSIAGQGASIDAQSS